MIKKGVGRWFVPCFIKSITGLLVHYLTCVGRRLLLVPIRPQEQYFLDSYLPHPIECHKKGIDFFNA